MSRAFRRSELVNCARGRGAGIPKLAKPVIENDTVSMGVGASSDSSNRGDRPKPGFASVFTNTKSFLALVCTGFGALALTLCLTAEGVRVPLDDSSFYTLALILGSLLFVGYVAATVIPCMPTMLFGAERNSLLRRLLQVPVKTGRRKGRRTQCRFGEKIFLLIVLPQLSGGFLALVLFWNVLVEVRFAFALAALLWIGLPASQWYQAPAGQRFSSMFILARYELLISFSGLVFATITYVLSGSALATLLLTGMSGLHHMLLLTPTHPSLRANEQRLTVTLHAVFTLLGLLMTLGLSGFSSGTTQLLRGLQLGGGYSAVVVFKDPAITAGLSPTLRDDLHPGRTREVAVWYYAGNVLVIGPAHGDSHYNYALRVSEILHVQRIP